MIWIIWTVLIIADSIFHWWMIERRKVEPNHTFAAIYRIAISLLLLWKIGADGNIEFWMFEIGAFFEFWLVFNILLNKWRGRPIDYLGRKSWLDKLERKSPSFVFNLFAKVVITAGMIYGYYHPYLLDNNYWK